MTNEQKHTDLELMLSSAISRDDAQERAIRNRNKLRITRGAHEKIKLYAELTSRITGTGMEKLQYPVFLMIMLFSSGD